MIYICAKLFIREEMEEKAMQVIKPLIEGSKNECGNISYEFTKVRNEENTYAFFEIWKDQDAFHKHGQTDHYRRYKLEIGECLFKENEVLIADSI